ncbi:MAG: transposase [Candidatus Omnitrophota bacterium]
MPRIARVVIPNWPHHIVQRGNRQQDVFFNDKDKNIYLDLLREYALDAGINFWTYSLMDNHVHHIAVPDNEESFARGFGEVHRRYTRMINFREGWRGYLWQGRFASYPLEESHLYAAMRYVELNAVRAGLVKRAEEYQWSGARSHVLNIKDDLLSDNFVISEIKDWALYLTCGDKKSDVATIEKCINTGRPWGSEAFVKMLENLTGRVLRKGKPGRKRKN